MNRYWEFVTKEDDFLLEFSEPVNYAEAVCTFFDLTKIKSMFVTEVNSSNVRPQAEFTEVFTLTKKVITKTIWTIL